MVVKPLLDAHLSADRACEAAKQVGFIELHVVISVDLFDEKEWKIREEDSTEVPACYSTQRFEFSKH